MSELYEKEPTLESTRPQELYPGVIEATVLGYTALELIGFEDL